MARVLGGILCPLACFHLPGSNFRKNISPISVFSITAAHWHCKQRQGPCRRWCLRVRVRRQRLFSLVAAATRRRGREVMAHFVGALPLLESLSSNSQGARTHRQEHNERSQQQGHHWPEDAVQQDAGVMWTAPQHVVRPGITRKKNKSRVYHWIIKSVFVIYCQSVLWSLIYCNWNSTLLVDFQQ